MRARNSRARVSADRSAEGSVNGGLDGSGIGLQIRLAKRKVSISQGSIDIGDAYRSGGNQSGLEPGGGCIQGLQVLQDER